MSDTAANVMDRIRSLTNDRNQGEYVTRGPRMLAILSAKVIQALTELTSGDDVQAGLVTLVSGTDEYTLGGTNPPFTGVNAAVFNDSSVTPTVKRWLRKVTIEEYMAARAVGQQGKPMAFATYERSSDNTVRLVLCQKPTDAENGMTLDLWLNDGSKGLTADTDTLALQPGLLRAIEYAVASECIIGMPEEAMKSLGLVPQLAQQYQAQYERGLRDERARINNLRRGSVVAVKRV